MLGRFFRTVPTARYTCAPRVNRRLNLTQRSYSCSPRLRFPETEFTEFGGTNFCIFFDFRIQSHLKPKHRVHLPLAKLTRILKWNRLTPSMISLRS